MGRRMFCRWWVCSLSQSKGYKIIIITVFDFVILMFYREEDGREDSSVVFMHFLDLFHPTYLLTYLDSKNNVALLTKQVNIQYSPIQNSVYSMQTVYSNHMVCSNFHISTSADVVQAHLSIYISNNVGSKVQREHICNYPLVD